MTKRILITGGAGFIGSHLVDELVAGGYRVRVLDNLTPQVHGPGHRRPDYLHPAAELMVGDVRRPEDVRRALEGMDAVFHLAAAVGVGQSMYQVEPYTSINNLGTAVLWQEIIERPVDRFIVASSMSIYGEGRYRDAGGALHAPDLRPISQLREGRWEVEDRAGNPLAPVPTPEEKPPALASVYALSKYDQERMSLMLGEAYGLSTTALRFFNVYGPRQALSNPYTGVLAIFASRFLNGKPPLIFEDGRQKRDFVHVADVARSCRLALETPGAAGEVFNIGSGQSFTVTDMAALLARVLGKDIRPEITGRYRVGDIRHCFADIAKARRVLGYAPRVSIDQGLDELAGWLAGQISRDRVEEAAAQLAERGLTVQAGQPSTRHFTS